MNKKKLKKLFFGTALLTLFTYGIYKQTLNKIEHINESYQKRTIKLYHKGHKKKKDIEYPKKEIKQRKLESIKKVLLQEPLIIEQKSEQKKPQKSLENKESLEQKIETVKLLEKEKIKFYFQYGEYFEKNYSNLGSLEFGGTYKNFKLGLIFCAGFSKSDYLKVGNTMYYDYKYKDDMYGFAITIPVSKLFHARLGYLIRIFEKKEYLPKGNLTYYTFFKDKKFTFGLNIPIYKGLNIFIDKGIIEKNPSWGIGIGLQQR